MRRHRLHESALLPTFARLGCLTEMRVPSHVRRSVIFIGIVQNGIFRPKATGFLAVTIEKGTDFQTPYLITAEHVVSGLLSRARPAQFGS